MITWISKFQIALAVDGVGALRPLSDLVLAEPNRVPYQPYTRIVGKNGNGHSVEMGFPIARWEWDWLPQTDIDVLGQFQQQDVLIVTEVETGVTREFKTFACYAQRLQLGDINRRVAFDGNNDGLRQRRSAVLEFYGLIEQ